MTVAVSAYDAVKALHIMAAISAYGLPLAYPMLLPYVRRAHPRAMPALHDVQHRLNVRLTGPGTVLLLAFGAYMAGKHDLWGEAWVEVGLGVLVAIVVLGGWIVRATERMALLARADVTAAAAPGAATAVTWSAEYEALYRRYMAVETLLGALVLLAVFFMAAKPFS
jgi:uncharacterized membrane protein